MILTYKDLNNPQLGGKAYSLANLSKLAEKSKTYNIPNWFVVPSSVFTGWIQCHSIDTVNDFNFTVEEEKEILNQLVDDKIYAIRSSARAEDSKNNSFAGQFETYLGIKKDQVLETIKKVYLSGLSDRIKVYTKNSDLKLEDLIPSVIVQELVQADKAGVAFSVNPVNGNQKEIVISAVFGLGSGLVDGTITADTVTVNKISKRINRVIGKKELKEIYIDNKVEQIQLTKQESLKEVLEKNETRKIEDLVYDVENYNKCPQDIEWAIKDNQLYLLQARPITNLKTLQNTSDTITVWDNSNIVESYGGIVSPMTYSFIRYAYAEVYKQMCKMFNVSSKILNHNDYTFNHMLGYINGRVYYNMMSWYKLLTMLPGYNFNKDFMIQMMGSKQPLSNEALKVIEEQKYPSSKIEDIKGLLFGLYGFGYNYFKIRKFTDKFYDNVKNAIGRETNELKYLSLSELAEYYRKLERKLIRNWDAPVINDFFAMIFYGVLRKCSENWLNGELKEIYNDLLCGDGQIISTQPAKKIKEIATLSVLLSTPDKKVYLPDIFKEKSLEEIEENLLDFPELKEKINDYLKTFGGRCLEELKLETETLEDNPLSFYRTIGYTSDKLSESSNNVIDEVQVRKNAEERYKKLLKNKPFKKLTYGYIVKKARYFVRNRENLRFERTRIFGTVRKIINQIGEKLYLLDYINTPKDIFYLELNEVLGFIEGNGTNTDLKETVKLRKQQEIEYKKITMPQRFTTHGSVNSNNYYVEDLIENTVDANTEILTGIGCCPGIIKGKIRIITDPKDAVLEKGEIMVAERTDPGWIMLFPMSSAVLVEKGSLLSHAAIVVREMGIPAVVGVDGLLSWLKTGDIVEINGATGTIKKVKE